MALVEPQPLWPQAARLCPQRSLPRYRFTPGLNFHPSGHPQGHSYGNDIAKEISMPLPPERWRDNEIYLFGIDLYHQGYFWESHEAWEALWHFTDKEDGEGQFLQGLIQNSAAQLKVHLKQVSAAKHLSHEAWERLCFVLSSGVCDEKSYFMGIDVSKLVTCIQTYYGPLWTGGNSPAGQAPRLEVVP